MEPRILYLIKRLEIECTSRMTKTLEKNGITPILFAILYFVDYDEGDLSSAQLSRRFSMTPQSMNELISVLVRKKLIKKTVDSNHKRILRLALTTKGKKLLKVCNSELDSLEKDFLKGMTKSEVTLFKKLIGKLLEISREAALSE